tara:strand:+ start:139 stop:507 length:369 start_codon:yes stop_codon:yes gene_type:complete
MKKNLITNATISAVVFILLLLLGAHFWYYVALLFFLTISLIVARVLTQFEHDPKRFVVMYGALGVAKMLVSAAVLVGFYLFFSDTITMVEKIKFSAFYLALYFIHLIFNTKNFFKNSNEKKT